MSEVLELSREEITPDRQAVLRQQGIPADRLITASVEAILAEAIELLMGLAAPKAALAEIARDSFTVVYEGEGLNEPQTPVAEIVPRAGVLALFAATLGEGVSLEIAARFAAHDLVVGYMLDSAASVAADLAADAVQRRFAARLAETDRLPVGSGVMHYSPGYCGWHISGQRRLFDYLRPERIGVTLRESFLMQPLKSVSGVIIAGPREIHDFDISYPFCGRCDTLGCRERIRTMLPV